MNTHNVSIRHKSKPFMNSSIQMVPLVSELSYLPPLLRKEDPIFDKISNGQSSKLKKRRMKKTKVSGNTGNPKTQYIVTKATENGHTTSGGP